MNIEKSRREFLNFRESLYQSFTKRGDTAMDLVDALSSNLFAQSPVELSLSPFFERDHTSLYKMWDETEVKEKTLVELLWPYVPAPKQRSWWLFGVDVTPYRRPFASRLADRSYVYEPSVIRNNKPVIPGHAYSTVGLLPEAESGLSRTWVIPLLTRRVQSTEDKELVGAEQINLLLSDPQLPWHDQLCVEVKDSSYSKPVSLQATRGHANLVTVTRLRKNRVLYRQHVNADDKRPPHHPRWYGAKFNLKDEQTWHPPDEKVTYTEVTAQGKRYTLVVSVWYNMLMRGQRSPTPAAMHQHPFSLLQVLRYREDAQLACSEPLWLIAVGEQRHRLSGQEIQQAYAQRFDLEHFFRFGKQKLLLTSAQTPDTPHEQTWWQLVHLAYAQLWMARSLVQLLPRPWERSLPAVRSELISPSLVQRDLTQLITQFGTPAQSPKPRGYSPGRPKGTQLPPKPRLKIVFKGVNTS